MSKYYKITIEDFNNYGCTDLQSRFLISRWREIGV